MSRGLTANQITRLEREEFKTEDLLEISFAAQTGLVAKTFYYTTGDVDIDLSTPTSGGTQTYTNRSFTNAITKIRESYTPLPLTTTLTFERLSDGGLDDDFLAYLNQNAITGAVRLYKLFRVVSTNAAETTNGLIQYFDGTIGGLDIATTLETKQYIIRCTSDFGDFDNVRGRKTSDIYGAGYDQQIRWGDFVFDR